MTGYQSFFPEHNVLLKRGEFIDDSRGQRKIVFKIYYPGDYSGGKLPVIVWSHGYGGNRDGAGFLSRYIAAYGYVVVHPTHPGSDSSLWEGKKGHPWDVLRKNPITREMTVERFKDIPFLLDRLPGWAQENPEVGAMMDVSVMGMSGHSFGAMTTQAMAGQRFPSERGGDEGNLEQFADRRFRAAIAYSPVPNQEMGEENPEKYFYGSISLPIFYMTGTKDESPLNGFSYQRRLAVYEHTGTSEKYLLVLESGDHMVYNGTRGQLEANPNRELHEEIIKILSLAFWDAYLKNDARAMAWLKEGGAAEFINQAGQLKIPSR